MPGHLASNVLVGAFGKLPARGDFVRFGLPRDFTDAWDAWLMAVMRASKEEAGELWLPAFLEAPVWRFVLPAGLCGSRAVAGLMLPSVDRAGRYFPLVIAALAAMPMVQPDLVGEWLDLCEDAGRDALEYDQPPEILAAALTLPKLTVGSGREAIWWTEGAPRVAATRLVYRGLPNAAAYAAMLGLAGQGAMVITEDR